VAAKFIEQKTSQARTGQRTPGRLANIQTEVKQFVAFAGADKGIRRFFPASSLVSYHERQIEEIDAEEISPATGSDRMQVARQFIRLGFENNY